MKNKAIFRYIFELSLYGTIGLFLHFIDYSSEFVILCRGLLGSLLIFIVLCIRKEKIDFNAIKQNLLLRVTLGIALGLNWMFLFADQ